MQKLAELQNKKNKLKDQKRMLDKDAHMDTWEGRSYARLLTQLVLIELEIENMQKDALADALK
jgi:hypothetical protein